MKVELYEMFSRQAISRRNLLKGAASVSAMAMAGPAFMGLATRPTRRPLIVQRLLQIPGVGKGSPTDADWQKVGEMCLGATKANVKEGEFKGVELSFMGLNNQNLHNVLFRGLL